MSVTFHIYRPFDTSKDHNIKYNISYLKSLFGSTRNWRRINRKLDMFSPKIAIDEYNEPFKYIPVEEIYCAQGWFLKKRFFNKKCTYNICITRKEMEKFFNRYVDFKKDFNKTKSITKALLENYKDGDVFVVSW